MSELIDEHVAHLRAAGYSEGTIEPRVGAIKRLNAALPFGILFGATEQIENWLAGLRRKGRSKATIFIYSYHVRAFYSWACAAGYLDGNPMGDMPKPKQPKSIPKPVTDEELSAALDCTGCWRLIGLLAAYQGMRDCEMAPCEREHITEDLTLIPHAKGGDPSTVPTHPLVWEAVRHMPPGRLILDKKGQPVTARWITENARYFYPRILGLPKVRPHRLRHWYATSLLEAGVDLRTVQELLRHKSINSTLGYTLVTDARRRQAVQLLPDLTAPEPGTSRLGPPAAEAA